jgi:hypothetical protein
MNSCDAYTVHIVFTQAYVRGLSIMTPKEWRIFWRFIAPVGAVIGGAAGWLALPEHSLWAAAGGVIMGVGCAWVGSLMALDSQQSL